MCRFYVKPNKFGFLPISHDAKEPSTQNPLKASSGWPSYASLRLRGWSFGNSLAYLQDEDENFTFRSAVHFSNMVV